MGKDDSELIADAMRGIGAKPFVIQTVDGPKVVVSAKPDATEEEARQADTNAKIIEQGEQGKKSIAN